MEHLYKGVEKYLEKKFPNQKEKMEKLAEGQNPASLLLTCSDSRISVNEFTSTQPGEVFVIRNAGNAIEKYDPEKPSNVALTLEYGVVALGISEVVVCGHSKCGAMQGIQNLQSLKELPLVQKGLERISKNFSKEEIETLSLENLIELNVMIQMKNIYSYPFIKERYANNTIHVWGWVYNFTNGEIEKKISLSDVLERVE